MRTSGEYPKVLTKPPKYPHHFLHHTEHPCAMSVVLFVMLLLSVGQENVKALKQEVGVLCSDPCSGMGLLTGLGE